MSGTTIDNLVIEVAQITGNSYLGALAGKSASSDINRVQIKAVGIDSKIVASSGENIGGMLGVNLANIELRVNLAKTSSNLHDKLIFNLDCSIVFDNAAAIQSGDRLQLDAIITKEEVSLTKKFIIKFQ